MYLVATGRTMLIDVFMSRSAQLSSIIPATGMSLMIDRQRSRARAPCTIIRFLP